jgi:PST family polysaccharide transporter
VYAIVRRQTGFRWSPGNRQVGLIMLPIIGVVFCGFLILPSWAATAVGVLGTVVSAVYSLRMLCQLVSLDRVPRAGRELLELFRIASPRSVPDLELGS